MMHGYKMVREAVKQCPLPLLHIKEKNLIKCAEDMLPYSVGIEIECHRNMCGFSQICKETIPELIAVKCDDNEIRVRIPNGIKGMIALYRFADFLKENAALNPLSGVHYHIDFTDIPKVDFLNLLRKHYGTKSFILKSLKSWGYKGTYNEWLVSQDKSAVRFHCTYQTLEFRIGEMTFEYELLMKRILNCQNISKALKSSLKSSHPTKDETKVVDYPVSIGYIQF